MKSNRNLWPFGIIAAFGLFFIGMASVVVIASTHREHLVNPNYYEQELKFQGQIDATARARKAGANLLYDSAAGRVVFSLPAAQITQNFSGTMTLYRANAPELDREFLLQPRADGTQTFDVSKLAPGPWHFRAAWVADGNNYFLEEKIIVTGR